jgi:IS30 family transposase
VARFTEAEKAEVWDRYRAGEPMRLIGRRLGRQSSSIRTLMMSSGGIRPYERRRDPRNLSGAEREEISRGVAAAESARAIARRLGRSASTVCRELARNGGRYGYRATRADQSAWQRARRPASWPPIRSSRQWWRPNCGRGGHLNRSPGGSQPCSRTQRRCECHTKRST